MLLAIETSSRQGSIAFCDDGTIVAEKSFAHGLQNAAMILPLIQQSCQELGISPRDIHGVAVSIGPGSFTGLRIGVTLAKSFCFATGAKLIAVPTMPVMALNAPHDAKYVTPILDAKRDQVFAAVYRRQSHKAGAAFDEVIAPHLVHLPDLLAKSPRPLLVLGEGVKYHMQHLLAAGVEEGGSKDQGEESTKEGITIAPEELWYPKASNVVHLAQQLIERGAFADPFKLTPLYIRKPEAQERMEAGLLKHLEM